MVKIPLTQGKVAIIDDCDAHLSDYKWFFNKGRNSLGYAVRKFKNKKLSLHHAIMGFPLHGKQIDHINGDGLDERRENLRIVTQRENTHNQKCHRNGSKSSKYIGVKWFKRDKKWYARIWINGKSRHIGVFKNEEDASDAYQKALKNIHQYILKERV